MKIVNNDLRQYAVCFAADAGSQKVLAFLLGGRIMPSTAELFEDQKALIAASKKGHAEIVKLLLAHDANVNQVDKKKSARPSIGQRTGENKKYVAFFWTEALKSTTEMTMVKLHQWLLHGVGTQLSATFLSSTHLTSMQSTKKAGLF